MNIADADGVGVSRVQDLIAYQLTLETKLAVYRLVGESSSATRDLSYRTQVFDAISGAEANIAEGFDRCGAREFRRFLLYARASIGETKIRIVDGIHRGYFQDADCAASLNTARRASAAIMALHRSLAPFTNTPQHPGRSDPRR